MGTKKVGSSGRFRANYGKKIRRKVSEVEKSQRQRQVCPYCKKKKIERLSKGIWKCNYCNKKFTSNMYTTGEK
jgi:large subunit ribosomal protein L37Ae